MLYVGLDAHWRQSSFCVLDGQGRKILSRTVQGRWSGASRGGRKSRQAVRHLPRSLDRLRLPLRPITEDDGPSCGRSSKSAATDLPFQAEERPGGCGEAGEAFVSGVADPRAVERDPVVATDDRAPTETDRRARAGEEQHSGDAAESGGLGSPGLVVTPW